MIPNARSSWSREDWRRFGTLKNHGGLVGTGPTRDWNLTQRAYQIATDKYGSERLSKAHSEAFMYLAGRLTHMANGHVRKMLKVSPKSPLRLAYGLACGGGKTLMAQSWMAAVHHTGKAFSVCYAASEVRALCDIKTALERNFGVPSEKIGLLHSYKCDPEKVKAGKPGYASLPATPDAELHQKQFLLCTHSLVQTGKPALDRYYAYGPNHQPRSLVIYDESLLVSDAWSLQLKHADLGVSWLRIETKYEGEKVRRLRPILRYAEDCLAKLAGTRNGVVHLPSLEDYSSEVRLEPDSALLRIPESCPGAIKTLVRGANRDVRVLNEGGKAAAWFSLKVPAELHTVFVLDASYLIRALPRLNDSNVKPDPAAPRAVFDYSQLKIETFQHSAGRGSIETESKLPWPQRDLARKVADWIKALPADWPVLIWTFKQRGRGVDIPARLKEALERHGCDLSRIRVVTHGRARGSNDYQDARAVAWYGVLEPDSAVTSAQMLGELQNLSADLGPHDPRFVHGREILHEVSQEGQRCINRVIVNGVATGARWFIPCWYPAIIRELAADYAYPGAEVVYRDDLEPDSVRARLTETQTARVAEAIRAALKQLSPDVRSISAMALRAMVPESDSDDVWKAASAAAAKAPPPGMYREGRRWHRTELPAGDW